MTKEELLKYLQGGRLKNTDEREVSNVFITAGAGDIDQLVQPIKEILMNYIQ